MKYKRVLAHVPYCEILIWIGLALTIGSFVLAHYIQHASLIYCYLAGVILLGGAFVGKVLHTDYRDNSPFLD